MKYSLLLLALFLTMKAYCQKATDRDTIPEFYVAEEMPTFSGGEDAFYKWIYDKIYHAKTDSTCIITKIYISFTVDTTGKIIHPEVSFKNPLSFSCKIFESFCKSLESELIDMPAWTSGKQKGKKVRVRYNIPLNIDWQ